MRDLSSDFQRLLKAYKPLTDEEEEDLLARYKSKQHRVYLERKLVLHNLRLAKNVASNYGDRTESEDDLMTIAIIGLVKAARDFDPTRDVRFCTFAYHRIRSAFGVLTNEDRVDVQMQRATAAVLDAPMKSFEEDEDGKTYGDDLTSLGVSPDWSQPDPGRIFKNAAAERERDELIGLIYTKFLRGEKPKNRNIVLRLMRGETQTSIARSIGTTKENVRGRLKPVLARLRSSLRREGITWR